MSARMVSLAIALITTLGPAGPGALGAQTGAPAAWQATPASVLKAALRTTAAAQERYFSTHRRYAESVEQLDVRPEAGVRVDILGAGTGGWQARAIHQTRPGRSCVVFVGALDGGEAPRTDGDREMAGEAGIPLCDRMR